VEVNDEQVHLVYRINPNSSGDAPAQLVLQDCPADAGAMPQKSSRPAVNAQNIFDRCLSGLNDRHSEPTDLI
jgi:hypothetical protein